MKFVRESCKKTVAKQIVMIELSIHIKLRQYLFTVNVLCFAVEGKSLTNFRYLGSGCFWREMYREVC